MIDSDVPWGLINGPALIILFGYFDNENGLWNSKLRSIILVVVQKDLLPWSLCLVEFRFRLVDINFKKTIFVLYTYSY